MINPQKAVEWYKKNYRHGATGLSDYEIYEMLKQDYTKYEYPENPFKQRTQSLGRPRTPQDVEEETEQGYLGKLSLMSLPELWADDHEWAARAYNNSLAGTIYQIANGKPKYQVEGESSGVAEDIGAFFLGLASPIDIFTFLGSGAVGGYTAAKTIGTTGLKTVAGKVLKDNLTQGDRCLLVSENRPEWLIADLAIMLADGITVPAYTTYTEKDYKYLIDDCKPTVIIVSNNEMHSKLKNIIKEKDFIKKVITFDELSNVEKKDKNQDDLKIEPEITIEMSQLKKDKEEGKN